jgi:hypothetical protein
VAAVAAVRMTMVLQVVAALDMFTRVRLRASLEQLPWLLVLVVPEELVYHLALTKMVTLVAIQLLVQ